MRDKTEQKVKTFELKTFEGENKTGRKVKEKSGLRRKVRILNLKQVTKLKQRRKGI